MSRRNYPKHQSVGGKKQVKCTCDKCGATIIAMTQEFSYDPKTHVDVRGIRCKHCGAEYVVSVTDNKVRALMFRCTEKREELEKLHKGKKNESEGYLKSHGRIPDFVTERWDKKIEQARKEYKTAYRTAVKAANELRAELGYDSLK